MRLWRSMDTSWFCDRFKALTGQERLPWQERLWGALVSGEYPSSLNLPTGAGKTSVIGLWLLACGWSMARGSSPVPRRLIYIVNRRVIVDSASDEAQRCLAALTAAVEEPGAALHDVAQAFLSHCAATRYARQRGVHPLGSQPAVLGISTLRGQLEPGDEWCADPSRPGIAVGTPDMLGSRLLFAAYGRVGRWGLPYQAGLLGQDALLVLDEAHLSEQTLRLLQEVRALVAQRRLLRPVNVVAMSATGAGGAAFGLSREDEEHPVLRQRLWAPKRIALLERPGTAATSAQLMAERALELALGRRSVLVVANTVRMARRIYKALQRGGGHDVDCWAMTGTMRGVDRQRLMEDLVFRQSFFARDRWDQGNPRHPLGSGARGAVLVATSCAEVGADIDADDLVTESTHVDRLVQRVGRVNRRGLREDSLVLVLAPEDVAEPAWVWLVAASRDSGGELSASLRSSPGQPRTVPERVAAFGADERKELFEPRPWPHPLERDTVDALALTTLRQALGWAPDPDTLIHGFEPEEVARVRLAWRDELDAITDPAVLAEALSAYPIAPGEVAEVTIGEARRVVDAVRKRAAAMGRVVLTQAGGGWVQAAAWLRAGNLYVLPPSAGGYDNRCFVDDELEDRVRDVADEALPTTWNPRVRLAVTASGWSRLSDRGEAQLCPLGETELDLAEAKALAGGGALAILNREAWKESGLLVLLRRRRGSVEDGLDDDAGSSETGAVVTLPSHLEDAALMAGLLVAELLPGLVEEGRAVQAAARGHDLGKVDPRWQAAAGNNDPGAPVAKSVTGQTRWDLLGGLRHERLSAEMLAAEGVGDALTLHLAAAHHGWARPCFLPESGGDLGGPFGLGSETARRFLALQERYGWWQLAYLEALVKAADALVSRTYDA